MVLATHEHSQAMDFYALTTGSLLSTVFLPSTRCEERQQKWELLPSTWLKAFALALSNGTVHFPQCLLLLTCYCATVYTVYPQCFPPIHASSPMHHSPPTPLDTYSMYSTVLYSTLCCTLGSSKLCLGRGSLSVLYSTITHPFHCSLPPSPPIQA